MRKYLLPENGRFYKANLHCHSTYSDGRLTPEELKDAYKKKGYSVLAITDHEGIFDHGYLDDEEFLTIPGYEREINCTDPVEGGWNSIRTCHLCFYPKDRENINCVMFDPDFVHPHFKWMNTPEMKEKMTYIGEPFKELKYDVPCINKILDEANKNGFLVSLNHLEWSYELYEQFSQYEGMFATEIYNHSAFEYNERYYDMLLRLGKRIYCLAGDDNHNRAALDSADSDSFGGFIMIKAPALAHDSIIDALQKGNFYASTGPEIKSLYIEDGVIHIECSKARAIVMYTGNRYKKVIRAEAGETVTAAQVPLRGIYEYFRFEVIDERGYKAFTNACFVDTL